MDSDGYASVGCAGLVVEAGSCCYIRDLERFCWQDNGIGETAITEMAELSARAGSDRLFTQDPSGQGLSGRPVMGPQNEARYRG